MRLAGLACYPVKSLGGVIADTVTLTSLGLDGDRRWAVIGADGTVLTQRQFARMAAIRALPGAGGSLRLHARTGIIDIAPPVGEHGRAEAIVWGTRVDTALAAPEASAFLSGLLDTEARLVRLDREDARRCGTAPSGLTEYTSLADSLPVLVTTTGSLAALGALLAQAGLDAVPMDRFRANLIVEHDTPWAEHGWRGLRIGAAELRLAHPCERCQVPTIDQRTGEVDPRSAAARGLLRVLAGAAGIGRKMVFGVNAVPLASTCPATLHVGERVTVTG